MSDISESLADRVSILELLGLSLREIFDVDFNNYFIPTNSYLKNRETCLTKYTETDIWKIIHKGMYPELYDVVDKNWKDFYASYIATYIERDINSLIMTDSLTFTKFLTVLAARSGQVLNYSNISNEVDVSVPTIKKWILILERTGIIYILKPYSASVLSRSIKSPKIYFRDTGLLCYLTKYNSSDTLKDSAFAGNVFETFVVSEILKSYSNAGEDYTFNIFYYRGKDKKISKENEIDLIIEEDGIQYPVKIKMTGNPKVSMGSANEILSEIPSKKLGLGVILCLIDKKTYLSENLVALPIEYI